MRLFRLLPHRQKRAAEFHHVPQRSRLTIEEVAEFGNLMAAFELASRGKRRQPEVQAFSRRLEKNLSSIGHSLREGTITLGKFHRFEIRDPKPRIIHAPCFRDRVVHHALIRKAGPILERSLSHHTYACRAGKGPLRAVVQAQHNARRHPFYVKRRMRVERTFRSMKVSGLEVRPIFHRTEPRVRAHIFLCMLAEYVQWHMRNAWRESRLEFEARHACR